MLPLIALLFISILYSHALSLDAYGLYQSVWMYANLVSVIIGYGLSTIIFSTHSNAFFDFVKQHKRTILIFYSLLWIIALIIFLVITNFSPYLKFLIVLFILIQNVNTISETWLIKNHGERSYFYINLLYAILFFTWHYYILSHDYQLQNVIAGIVVLSVLKFLFLFLFRKTVQPVPFESLAEGKFFSHWNFAGINDVLSIFTKWIDKLILVYLLSSSDFAIFFNGSIEIPLFAIFISMTGNYMMMQMSKGPNDPKKIMAIFKENFLFLSSLVFPLFYFLFFFRHDLFPVFFSEKYNSSIPIFAITILILPFRINSYGSILQVFSKSNIVTKGSILDLILATMLIFILYPVYGMKGAAAALLISSIIQICFYLFHTAKTLNVKIRMFIPFIPLLTKFIVAGIVFYLLKVATKEMDPVLAIFVGFASVLIFVLVSSRKFLLEMMKKEKL